MSNPFRIQGWRLIVGPEAEIDNVVGPWYAHVHVADVPPRQLTSDHRKVFWYPINEMAPWSYSTFYAVKRTLDELEPAARRLDQFVYLSCSGGICRSPMMAYGWLMSRGLCHQEICLAMAMPGNGPDQHWNSKYKELVGKKIIPDQLPGFYRLMDEHPTWCVMSLLRELGGLLYLRRQ